MSNLNQPLKYARQGQRVSAQGWNDILAALKILGIGTRPEFWLQVDGYNNTGAFIPPYSAFSVKVGTVANSTGGRPQPIIEAEKGGGTFLATNGAGAIADGVAAPIQIIQGDTPVPVTVTNGTTLVVGSNCGPTSSTWDISTDGKGLYSLSSMTGTGSNRAYVIAAKSETAVLTGSSNGSITAFSGTEPGTGTVDRYSFDGTDVSDSGTDDTVYNLFSVLIPTGTNVTYMVGESGYYWIVSADC